MPSQLIVIRPMASPIRGSNPNWNVQLGVSITLSRLMNSWTRISPMVSSLFDFSVLTARTCLPLPGGLLATSYGQAAGLEGFRGQHLVHGAGPGGARLEQVVPAGRCVVGEQPLARTDGD